MSPIKPSAPQRQLRSSSTMSSSLPRRVRTATTSSTSTSTKPKKVVTKIKKSAPIKDSVINDSTAKNLPAGKATSYFSKWSEENKENIPPHGVMTRSRSARLNGGGSPVKGKAGISKPSSKQSPVKRAARRPLRQLTQAEIFVRDEATIGDLRRRRSGEHSGTSIEFDTQTAPLAAVRESSIFSTVETLQSNTNINTNVQVVEFEEREEIQVLKRTDSVESLKKKVDAIMAATSTASTTENFPALRKRLQTPLKPKHPAVSDASTPDAYAVSPSSSPFKLSMSPTKTTPILARQSPAITKSQPSPIRPVRMGLGAKTANVLLKEAEIASKETINGKRLINISGNADPKKKTLAKKAVTSSLRRAAGATPAAKTGLSGLSRMR